MNKNKNTPYKFRANKNKKGEKNRKYSSFLHRKYFLYKKEH